MNPRLRAHINQIEGPEEGPRCTGLCTLTDLVRCRFMVELKNGTRICKVGNNPCNHRVLSDDPEDEGYWRKEE